MAGQLEDVELYYIRRYYWRKLKTLKKTFLISASFKHYLPFICSAFEYEPMWNFLCFVQGFGNVCSPNGQRVLRVGG